MCCILLSTIAVVACGGKGKVLVEEGKSVLPGIIDALASEQGVERNVVKEALESRAAGEAAELELARSWEATLPKSPVPDVRTFAERYPEFSDAAVKQLKSSVCSAVADILETGDVPNAEAFAEGYLQGLAAEAIPQAALNEVADDFESLYDQAVAGDLTSLDIRLEFMKRQYCSS